MLGVQRETPTQKVHIVISGSSETPAGFLIENGDGGGTPPQSETKPHG